MNTKVDIILTIVSHRTISVPTTNSLELLRIAQIKNELPFNYVVSFFAGDALISRGRSQACTKFLEETTAPFMLFIDDDIIFYPQDVAKVYNHLKSEKYDIIGGIYPVRGASQFSSYGWGGVMDADGSVKDIEYLATGFMGISRRILLKMKDELPLQICNPNDWARCYPFFGDGYWEGKVREKEGENLFISEDWYFCEQARKVGARIYADTSIQLGHIREIIYFGQDVMKVQSDAYTQQQIYGAINKQNELMRSVDTDLHEFMGITLQSSQDNIKKPQGKYIFEQALYHSQQLFFRDHLAPLVGIKDATILVIGCSIGTAVYMLEAQGNDVTGWDTDRKCIEFCEFKKNKYKLDGTFTTEKPDYKQFDIIVMVNYLNKVKDPESVIRELDIKRGAKIYHFEDKPVE